MHSPQMLQHMRFTSKAHRAVAAEQRSVSVTQLVDAQQILCGEGFFAFVASEDRNIFLVSTTNSFGMINTLTEADPDAVGCARALSIVGRISCRNTSDSRTCCVYVCSVSLHR